MRKIILIIILGVIVSCNNKKNEENINKPIYKELPEIDNNKIDKAKYQTIEDVSDKLDFIFQGEFFFSEDVILESIGLEKLEEDNYKVVFFIAEDSDFEKIRNLRLGMVFYPSDPKLLETEKEKNRGSIKTGVSTKIKVMGDDFVFTFDKFRLFPKRFKTVRFYFYNDEGVMGDSLFLNNVALR